MVTSQSDPLFLDDIHILSRFLCGRCNQIMVEPTQSECGCRFCLNCVVEFISKGNDKCPNCIDQIISKEILIRDKAIEKEIMNMKIKCSGSECDENLIFRQWKDHQEKCHYQQTRCDLCGDYYLRSRRQEHLKVDCTNSVIMCADCGSEITREYLKNIHRNYKEGGDNMCESWTIKCPYECNEKESVNIKSHLKICPNRPLQCPLQEIGCQVEGSRSMIDLHLKEAGALHQILMLREIQELRNSKEEMNKTFQEKEDSQMIQYQLLMKSNKDNEDKVKELKEKLEQVQRYSETLLSEIDKYKKQTKPDLKQFTRDMIFRLNDVTWTIKDIREKIMEAKSGGKNEIGSECFYIFRPGYNLSLKVYLNGDGRAVNKYLSVFFVINKGEYDSEISWPFISKVSISVLSNNVSKGDIVVRMKPDNNEDCYGRPSGKCNRGVGQPTFVQLSDILNKDDFLHDGSLQIRFSIN